MKKLALVALSLGCAVAVATYANSATPTTPDAPKHHRAHVKSKPATEDFVLVDDATTQSNTAANANSTAATPDQSANNANAASATPAAPAAAAGSSADQSNPADQSANSTSANETSATPNSSSNDSDMD